MNVMNNNNNMGNVFNKGRMPFDGNMHALNN